MPQSKLTTVRFLFSEAARLRVWPSRASHAHFHALTHALSRSLTLSTRTHALSRSLTRTHTLSTRTHAHSRALIIAACAENYPAFYENLGKCYQDLGDSGKAQDMFDKVCWQPRWGLVLPPQMVSILCSHPPPSIASLSPQRPLPLHPHSLLHSRRLRWTATMPLSTTPRAGPSRYGGAVVVANGFCELIQHCPKIASLTPPSPPPVVGCRCKARIWRLFMPFGLRSRLIPITWPPSSTWD